MSEEIPLNQATQFSLDNNFLFIFSPKRIDTESFCGIPLNIAVRIIAIIALTLSFYEIFNAIQQNELLYMLWSICLAVFFLIISFFTLLSTINNKTAYAQIGYYTFAVIFIIKIPFYFLQSGLMLLGFINPYGSDFFKIKAILYTLGEGISLVF